MRKIAENLVTIKGYKVAFANSSVHKYLDMLLTRFVNPRGHDGWQKQHEVEVAIDFNHVNTPVAFD